MIGKRRLKAAKLPVRLFPRCFRVTAITDLLTQGVPLEDVQIANHESPKTTKLYDRTSDQTTLDEVEKIVI